MNKVEILNEVFSQSKIVTQVLDNIDFREVGITYKQRNLANNKGLENSLRLEERVMININVAKYEENTPVYNLNNYFSDPLEWVEIDDTSNIKYVIIDGHNRLEKIIALKNDGINVEFNVTLNTLNVVDNLTAVNNTSKNHNDEDYLWSFARESDEYAKLITKFKGPIATGLLGEKITNKKFKDNFERDLAKGLCRNNVSLAQCYKIYFDGDVLKAKNDFIKGDWIFNEAKGNKISTAWLKIREELNIGVDVEGANKSARLQPAKCIEGLTFLYENHPDFDIPALVTQLGSVINKFDVHWRNGIKSFMVAQYRKANVTDERTADSHQKQLIVERDGENCSGPRCRVTGADNLHVDHKEPYIKGGETSVNNMMLLCPSCNSSKGKLTFDEWIKREYATV